MRLCSVALTSSCRCGPRCLRAPGPESSAARRHVVGRRVGAPSRQCRPPRAPHRASPYSSKMRRISSSGILRSRGDGEAGQVGRCARDRSAPARRRRATRRAATRAKVQQLQRLTRTRSCLRAAASTGERERRAKGSRVSQSPTASRAGTGEGLHAAECSCQPADEGSPGRLGPWLAHGTSATHRSRGDGLAGPSLRVFTRESCEGCCSLTRDR